MGSYCQFVLPEEKKIYCLMNERSLCYVNYETGKSGVEHEFPGQYSCYSYQQGSKVYFAYMEDAIVTLQVYDVKTHKVTNELQFPEIEKDTCLMLSAIGVSPQGDIYIGSRLSDTEGKIWVYDSEGSLKISMELPGKITRFYGFTSTGEFCYEIFYDYVYWGYSHDMAGLCIGSYQNGIFSMPEVVHQNMFQWYYGNYMNAAAVFNDNLAADYLGNIYKITNDENKPELKVLGSIQGRDISDAVGEFGSKTLYHQEKELLIGEGESNTLAIFDTKTFEKIKQVKTDYDIYHILWSGEVICCIEKEGNQMYVEIFELSDFSAIKTEEVRINEQDNYKGREKAVIAQKYQDALTNSLDGKILSVNASVNAPYQPGTMSDSAKEVSLNFTNYIRWLAGLTPYASGDETNWTEAAKAAVLAGAAAKEYGYIGHDPQKSSSMRDDFYESACNAIGGNLFYMSNNFIRDIVKVVRGWNNDELSSEGTSITIGHITYYEGVDSPTHRISFMQRGGSKISYGFTGDTAVQNYAYAQSDPNETGMISEVNNNEAAYVWPSAGYFPVEEISTTTKWSINLNTDKLHPSNENPIITITDKGTGEKWIRDRIMLYSGDTGKDYTNFWGYYIYFTPPEVESYNGKTFEVKIENRVTGDGNPVIVTYDTTFFSYGEQISDPMNPYTGLKQVNGEWLMYKNGVVDQSYTGLCKYNGSWWYVNSGRINFNYTGLCKYNGSWY